MKVLFTIVVGLIGALAQNQPDVSCKEIRSEISAHHAQSAATSFCSSYLSIRPVTQHATTTAYRTTTVTTTATVSKTSTTTTATATATESKTVTDVSTTLATLTQTMTSSFTTTLYASTTTSFTTIITSTTVNLQCPPSPKRDLGIPARQGRPAGFTHSWGQLSSACSCLSLHTPTTTETSTKTGTGTSVQTHLSTVIVGRTETKTVSATTTITHQATITSTTDTTLTSTTTMTISSLVSTVSSTSTIVNASPIPDTFFLLDSTGNYWGAHGASSGVVIMPTVESDASPFSYSTNGVIESGLEIYGPRVLQAFNDVHHARFETTVSGPCYLDQNAELTCYSGASGSNKNIFTEGGPEGNYVYSGSSGAFDATLVTVQAVNNQC